jgi:hypothetical protein
VKFVATKKCLTNKFFSPLSFLPVFGSGIRDPRSGIRDPGSGMGKNQDPGSGIRDKHPGSATLPYRYKFITGKFTAAINGIELTHSTFLRLLPGRSMGVSAARSCVLLLEWHLYTSNSSISMLASCQIRIVILRSIPLSVSLGWSTSQPPICIVVLVNVY